MEMELIKVSEKGQVVIPSSLRKTMNIQKSDKFLVFGEGDTILLKKVEEPVLRKSFEEIAKPLQKAAKNMGLTRKDLEKAIKEVRNA